MFDDARDRLAAAERLVEAIEACDPDYAGRIMLRALEAMFHGPPDPPLDDLESEARFWASLTCTAELVVVARACAEEIGQRTEDRRFRVDLAARLMAGRPDREWREAYESAVRHDG